MEETQTLDGRREALQLIATGSGTVTPYGVVYDNGMELERLYDGRHFPAYQYKPPLLVLEVSAKKEPETPLEYLYLPAPTQQIQRAFLRAGVGNTALRTRIETDELPERVSAALHFDEDAIPHSLNALCRDIDSLGEADREKLNAVICFAEPSDMDEISRLTENLDLFDFYPGVQTPEEYGRYMIRESGRFEYDENLDGFYDFQGYGLQKIESEFGEFGPHGYISYHGTLLLDELMQDDPAEQSQREQGPQMGGLA